MRRSGVHFSLQVVDHIGPGKYIDRVCSTPHPYFFRANYPSIRHLSSTAHAAGPRVIRNSRLPFRACAGYRYRMTSFAYVPRFIALGWLGLGRVVGTSATVLMGMLSAAQGSSSESTMTTTLPLAPRSRSTSESSTAFGSASPTSESPSCAGPPEAASIFACLARASRQCPMEWNGRRSDGRGQL